PLAPPRPGSAAPQSALFGFAQTLYAAGEYYRAIGELQRFLFFQPDHPLASEAHLTIGLAYFCGERWLQAFEVFRQVTRATPDASIRAEAALWMAETRARGGDQVEAARLYQELIRQYPGSAIAQRAAYLIGWGYLRQRRWTDAREAFAQVDEKSPYRASGERLAAALDSPPELPQRSPTVARLLSTVLPGAGQLYTGHTVDGLIGLGLHGALIAGTTGAVMAGLEGAAGISAFFTWGFYQTQMTNAAVLAQDFNLQAEERFLGQLAVQERPFLSALVRALPCKP
ncbi:MAG TPA: tetratricopeptide repeat protein, partial [Candidatus Tectomicrobia bacterium]